MTPPTSLPAWAQLQALAAAPQTHLRDMLAADAGRSSHMTLTAAGIELDASRQRVSPAIQQALLDLAEQAAVAPQRDAMFKGEHINLTEDRPVLHVALRADPMHTGPWGPAVQAEVQRELARICDFAEALRAGTVRGHAGDAITDVVNIGIGGSDLGPRMAADALAHLAHPGVRVHYVSNPDAWALWSVLRTLDAKRTLLIVSSKTFTTQETLTNAASAQRWLTDNGCPADALAQHLVAITASPQQAARLGYPSERTFLFWDWVGGRYSVWSALGLPLAIAIGAEHFRLFLAGARAMDEHFCHTPLAQNLPVQMALHGIWNRNFLRLPTHLIVPYASRLARFTPFVQQMDMESNGKRTHTDGTPAAVATGPIVWGGLGIDGQHAYFQLIHQGMHTVPVDFIGVENEDTPLPMAATHHEVVNLNLRAQAEAMARGRSQADTQAMLQKEGLSAAEARTLAPHRSFEGNIPSHILWLDRLDPARLGALIALYEHKVFTQAAIWRINAYDQWGVELGKTMAKALAKTA
ncbi:glucose-6-phosphate isomerase [Hydrogenophaga sp. BPS33]|uniref:glucose-6-phosphate isomerase n=1 Tax=Hydrogenophaga sp. BPS33 TaxID=2651974 RepID=UPI0013203D54|nr:glucose-6-phosphate isomerase [Hydrogenophaga sp. BPS33]QHE87063.1 glucose-6-phosphate isomerase [Hydrogenophaga sp. BPS33]